MSLIHRIEAGAMRAALVVLRALGPVRASNVCGAAARWIGPILPVSRIADRNLRLAMPSFDAAARRRVIRGVWDNLGRTAGEFPHLGHLHESASGPGWEIVGAEHLDPIIQRGGPAIVATGHIGNWEVLPLAAMRRGVVFAALYRPANNKLIDEMVLAMRVRSAGKTQLLFPKGAQGARQALLHLRKGGYLALLQDQKMNDGIEARFFGRPAMTASALASLALKVGCPVLPCYVRRLGPARFRIVCEQSLALPDTGNRAADVASLTQAVNDRLEAWIRAAPESWLWLHRRWPKELYADRR